MNYPNIGILKSRKLFPLSFLLFFCINHDAFSQPPNFVIIVMDDDLEDPPEVIPSLIAKSEEGYDVVYATRNTAKLPFYKNFLKTIFYKVFKIFANQEFNIPSNTGDYRIIDKKIKNILTSMRERIRFLRGLISYIGFKQTGILFDRPIRKKGKSKIPKIEIFRTLYNIFLIKFKIKKI